MNGKYNGKSNGKYDDMLDLPHPDPVGRPRMSLIDRAAQFSPFSALVGYEDAIAESGRLTQREQITEQDEKELLDRKLRYLHDRPGEEITVTYFRPDDRKAGGSYEEIRGKVLKIDPLKQLLFTENHCIPLGSIRDLQIPGTEL